MLRTEERGMLYEGLTAILANNGLSIMQENSLAVEKLCECLARLVRQFWSEDSEAKNTYKSALMLTTKQDFQAIGCMLLTKLIEEMTPQVTRPRPQHLRNSQVFKDDYLPYIFQSISDQFLLHLQNTHFPLSLTCLQVLISVLTFDSTEENGIYKCVLIGRNEREYGKKECWELLTAPSTPMHIYQLYFSCHTQLNGKNASICLQFLSLLSSINRYFYPDLTLRTQILREIVNGAVIILTQNIGVSHTESLISLCRLLDTLASVSIHTDIQEIELIQRFLTAVFNLTVALLTENGNDNAVFYLMQCWSRLIPGLINSPDYRVSLQAVTSTLIKTYLKSVSSLISHQDKDRELLDDAMISTVCGIIRGNSLDIALECLLELKNTQEKWRSGWEKGDWMQFLVRFCAMIMTENRKLTAKRAHPKGNAEISHLTPAEAELYGNISAELFKICHMSHQNPTDKGLNYACLEFLRCFQTVFLSENRGPEVMSTCHYLQTVLNVSEIAELWVNLDLQYVKIGTDVGDLELVVTSIAQFAELIEGARCERALGSREERVTVGAVRLQPQYISNLLSALLSKEIFLPYDSSLLTSRSLLYASAAKLLFWSLRSMDVEIGINWLHAHWNSHNKAEIQQYQAWLYETKGIVQAITLSADFTTWTEWFLEHPAAALQSSLPVLSTNIPLFSALLKLTSECSHNRVNRILFPQYSPLSPQFARFLTRVLTVYFTETYCIPVENDYVQRYKPFRRAIRTLTNLISGRYCTVSVVFATSECDFSVLFRAGLHCIGQVPMEDLLAYQKEFQCIWNMVDISTQYEALVPLLLSLSTEDINRILELCREGLQSLSNSARISSANILNNLISCISSPSKSHLQPIFDDFRVKTDLPMKRLLKSLLIVVFDGFLANTSLISKALLGLINHHQVYFQSLLTEIISVQSSHLQEPLRTAVNGLFEGTNFVWWQLQPVQSTAVIAENLQGARVFGENLTQMMAKVGRISWF